MRTESLLNLSISETNSIISITTSGIAKPINQGLYGINLEGIFKPSSLPNDGVSSEYAYEWLSELSPSVLRFPSGESAKLMHLLHNTDESDAVGYGYDIYEIARYFNATDGIMNVISDIDIFFENIDPEIEKTALSLWMESERVEDYLKFRDKCIKQQCESRRYIDDFIYLVNKINSENVGRPTVKVILSLNIISETASECRAIADYLRDHDVNVVGVELGNETYADFYCTSMGFRYAIKHTIADGDNDDNYAGNYWDYVNGKNYKTDAGAMTPASYDLADVLSDDMWYDHDFISAFKTTTGYNYKVGLVGRPLGSPYAFKVANETGTSGCDPDETWNVDLYSVYDEMKGSKYAFDAVILHNYYSADSWQNIPISPSNLVLNTDCDGGASELWKFDSADPRLQNAFKKIKGIGGEYGNFRDFIVNQNTPSDYIYSIQSSFIKFNEQLHFDLSASDPTKKELWVTEWNLKDVLPGYDANDPVDVINQWRILVYDNTFMQGVLLMQWWLKDIKLNYEVPYRQNFFTYSTFQGYGGGVWTDLLTLTSGQERAEQGMNHWPYSGSCPEPCLMCQYDDKFFERNYWMRRTTYFTTRLYSDIHRYNLKYVPSNFSYSGHNMNHEPTIFVDKIDDPEFLYVYVTNTNSFNQNYSLDPNMLRFLYFPEVADAIQLGTPLYSYIEASQLYSTSGFARLYRPELNECYNVYDHPTDELQLINWNEPVTPDCPPGIHNCLTALPYSIGYFKIPIIPIYLREGDRELDKADVKIAITPNPTAESFCFAFSQDLLNEPSCTYLVEIFASEGSLVHKSVSASYEAINIQNLPSGFYFITLLSQDGVKFNSQLIKVK